MKVVVFGGSGFLGSHVADSLTEHGHEVTIFDLNESDYLIRNQKMVLGNILDKDRVDEAVRGADFVYDFAGVADLDDASTRPIDTVDLNIRGTCTIIEACIKHHVKRFVYASSFYANSNKGGFYRCSKQAAELYIEEYERRYKLPYTILRYGSLYGTRVTAPNGVYDMLLGAYKDGVITYPGTGEELREYIHVKDAAELSVKIMDCEFENKHIVLTGHEAVRVRDMIKMICEIMDKPVKVVYGEQYSELHYHMTPYSFKPRSNFKLTSEKYIDLGQGIMDCLNEIHGKETATATDGIY